MNNFFNLNHNAQRVKESKLAQVQEFYGKRFLVKDNLYKIK
jgi:hypothetical protein